jgi:oxygen-independent coproporphyrinogen-3 oxidase
MSIPSIDRKNSIPALYLHFPFCRKVCPFCSFAVLKDNPGKHRTYLDLLKKEAELLTTFLTLDFIKLESIYLGGGTPSRLEIPLLQEFSDWLRTRFTINRQAEWSIEVNPEDVSATYAYALAKLDFSRVSIGVQSFNDSQLGILSRQHTSDQARNALLYLHNAGIENINIDLMFGYPGQTMQSLEMDLGEVLTFNPKHISVYSLTIEPKTALNRKSDWKNWIAEQETLIAEMYETIVARLAAAGFKQYEVSNFCRDGYQSRQNLVYWHHLNYLGLGLGAHSHVTPLRWGNVKRMVEYRKAITMGALPHSIFETLDPAMQRDEELMLALRLKDGLNKTAFGRKHQVDFSATWQNKIRQFCQHGMMEENGDRLVLTTKGMLIADEVSAILAAALS